MFQKGRYWPEDFCIRSRDSHKSDTVWSLCSHWHHYSNGQKRIHHLRLMREGNGFWVKGSPRRSWIKNIFFFWSQLLLFSLSKSFMNSISLFVCFLFWLKNKDRGVCVCVVYPFIQVILTVIELLRLCLPHELHMDLRVELPTLGELQLKHTHTQEDRQTHIPNSVGVSYE